jgi:hypothetical protein
MVPIQLGEVLGKGRDAGVTVNYARQYASGKPNQISGLGLMQISRLIQHAGCPYRHVSRAAASTRRNTGAAYEGRSHSRRVFSATSPNGSARIAAISGTQSGMRPPARMSSIAASVNPSFVRWRCLMYRARTFRRPVACRPPPDTPRAPRTAAGACSPCRCARHTRRARPGTKAATPQ